MKKLERLVIQFLKSIIDPLLDRFQLAHRVDDAVFLGFYVRQHLDSPIIPSKLFEKIQNVGVPKSMCLWILEFLLNRPQVVEIRGNLLPSLYLFNGMHQGSGLSPKLYISWIYIYHESTQILKVADDTIVLRLIINSDESEYRDSINKRICWCMENNRELNVNKTKEMIVDLRRKISSHISPLLIDGRTVEIFQFFKFLGSIISNNLKWELNVDTVVKKACTFEEG